MRYPDLAASTAKAVEPSVVWHRQPPRTQNLAIAPAGPTCDWSSTTCADPGLTKAGDSRRFTPRRAIAGRRERIVRFGQSRRQKTGKRTLTNRQPPGPVPELPNLRPNRDRPWIPQAPAPASDFNPLSSSSSSATRSFATGTLIPASALDSFVFSLASRFRAPSRPVACPSPATTTPRL